MKVSSRLRVFTRRTLGMGKAPSITPLQLAELAANEPVVVVAVGIATAPTADPRLPGEQRTASLFSLARVVADVPRSHAIVLHCG